MASRKLMILLATSFIAMAYAPAGRTQDTLAEASKKAREQSKTQPKTAKVFTDDDLADLKGQISVVGNAPAPAATDADTAKAAAATPGAKQPAVKGEAYWRQKFAVARRALADDSKELDVLQREFNLKQVQFYSNPDVALREQYSRKDLNDTQAEIDAKKQDVAKDNQALSDLQESLRTSGGEPGWANESSQPPASGDASSSPAAAGAANGQQAASPGAASPEEQSSDVCDAPDSTQPQQK